MKQTLLFLFFLFSLTLLPAQSWKAYLKSGDAAYTQEDYSMAFAYYGVALKRRPKLVNIQYKYAQAAYQYHSYQLAEKYYEKVWRSQERNNYPLTSFRLAIAKKQLGKYKEAIKWLETFLQQDIASNKNYAERAKKEIKSCQWAMEVIKQKGNYKIESVEGNINTPYSDFGAIQRGDTLYYSSYRFEPKDKKIEKGLKISKVLMTTIGKEGKSLRNQFNAPNKHTAHTTFSTDGNRMYFTQCQYVEKGGIHCAIFYREKDRRGRWQKEAVKLPTTVNKPGYTTTHPSIGYDSVHQVELLFFASDRPGTLGKLDIWYSPINKEQFGRPTNLVRVNTNGDDLTPFFHTSSQTLFFSSEGYQNLGGYDIYSIKRKGFWRKVQHEGYPLNSSYDDVYFNKNEKGHTAYFSSNRPGSLYLDEKNETCCYDIYRVEYPIKEQVPLLPKMPTEDSLIVLATAPVPPTATLFDSVNWALTTELEPEKLEDFLPLPLYFDNDEPDRRTWLSTTQKNYTQTFEQYFDQRNTYLQTYVAPLSKEQQGTAERKLNEFFEQEVNRGYQYLQRFSDVLLQRLQEGERIEIFLKGYTSPRAQKDYNLNLGKRRISSVRNHFQTFQNGAFQSYIRNGQLKISERSFGELTASKTVSDNLADQRNSIYSIEAAKERRVEIVEVKRNN